MSKTVRWLALVSILAILVVAAAACASPAPAPAPTTPKPPAPAPAPTSAAPAPAPAPAGLTLVVDPVTDGKAEQDVVVSATATPGASCAIKVTNPVTGTVSSYPTDKVKVAGADGKVSWTWKIPRQVAKGSGVIEVIATKDGQSITKTAPFTVTVSQY